MKLRSIDLNLLAVFDAIAADGNLSRAARRLGMSQPAMSNALARLREVLDDPLVEALEARRQEAETLLGGELLDELLGELAALRRERDDATRRLVAVDRLERRVDDVHAEHHPGAAAVGVVVHLPGPQRREVAVAEEPEVELGSEDGSQRALLGHPGEGVGNEREDVDLHRTARA